MGRRQVVRHRVLVPAFGGSNPSVPAKYYCVCWRHVLGSLVCIYKVLTACNTRDFTTAYAPTQQEHGRHYDTVDAPSAHLRDTSAYTIVWQPHRNIFLVACSLYTICLYACGDNVDRGSNRQANRILDACYTTGRLARKA